MSEKVTVTLGETELAQALRSKGSLAGVKLDFPEVKPIHHAFAEMARSQSYDVCEMAIAAFLQAYDAGKPLLMLSVAVGGKFHHKSLYAAPSSGIGSPADLKHRRVGIRSFGQTTGLWVRGWLQEEYGVTTDEVTWVVREGPHVAEFTDPPNVVRTDQSLKEAMLAGAIDAAILGTSSAGGLEPLVKDHQERARAWYDRHQCVPINHTVVLTRDVLEKKPAVVDAIYQTLADAIETLSPAQDFAPDDPKKLPRAIRPGIGPMRGSVRLAVRYALEQGLITKPVPDVDVLFALTGEPVSHA